MDVNLVVDRLVLLAEDIWLCTLDRHHLWLRFTDLRKRLLHISWLIVDAESLVQSLHIRLEFALLTTHHGRIRHA